jgi:capsular polysaccharide biosynthesis protein
LFLAAAYLVAVPIPHDAKAVLVLAHDPEVDAQSAMETDVSLLTTRVVAASTIENLGLTISPEDFMGNLTATADSTDLVTVSLTAPTDAEAVRRLEALTSTYLNFRAKQLTRESNVVVKDLQQRIADLQAKVRELDQRLEQLSAAGSAGASEQNDAISQRSTLTTQIETLLQAEHDAALKRTSLLSTSRVIDPAAAVPGGAKRRIVLTLASGLIGGAALGCGIVLFLAITSDRLRRRFDVATALGVPVTVSVSRIAPLRRRWLWIPRLRAADARRADERQRLANSIEMALPLPHWGRLAVACIDNAEDVRFAVASAAVELASRERRVLLIDLTNDGGVDAALTRETPRASANWPIVSRPRGVPALARGLADLGVGGGYRDPRSPPSPDLMDVTLVLADLDPSVGADHIAAWADRVIVSVTCGHSSAERVRTAADLVRAAGLDLQFGVLLRTDVTDESSGVAGRDRPRPVDSSDSSAQAKPPASSGDGSPPPPVLRSTSQAPEATAKSSSTQESRRQ